MNKNPLIALGELGQSIWLDYIRRNLLTGGELKRLIDEDGLKGMTSNPTIFEKAIGGSSDYDEAMKQLVKEGKGVQEIFDALVLEDIGKAADLLRPVYDKTGGDDGFVSIEVSPELARDTAGSIQEARRLFALLDRPNIMIKIPGTPEGIPAIETLIGDGVNVNITLLFSIENHEQVMEAYLKGLEKRVKQGLSIDHLASVASFFVSRVDTLTDQQLNETLQKTTDAKQKEKIKSLFGKTAVANAKLAYQKFKEVFGSPRFQALKAKGARVQRPLWASTSTKNPNYSDILYVQELIAKDSVNTIPPETLRVYKDHGNPKLTIEENLDGARATFRELAEVGIDLKQITKKLQEDGVKLFSESFQKLTQTITAKREAFLGGSLDKQVINGGKVSSQIQAVLQNLAKQQFIKRIWAKDATLWKQEPGHQKEIKDRLGWLTVVEKMHEHADHLRKFSEEVKRDGFKDVVLLGMGGSSLCPDVLVHTFGKIEGYPTLHILDSTDPATILEVEKKIDLNKTLFIVSSKSGGTTETDSLFRYFYEKVPIGKNFIAITDPGTSLEKLAKEKNFREIFSNPADIGGRYSALSYFGLVPAALMGIDANKLVDSALKMVHSCVEFVPISDNPGAVLGVFLGELWKAGKDKVTFAVPKPIDTFGYWVEQLIAESTGKEGRGLVPIEGEPLGTPDVYGNDRQFVLIHLREHPDKVLEQKMEALEKAGHPTARITLESPYDLGEEFFRWEFATAVAGFFLKINPFDQPNVQESKDITKSLLETYKKEKKLPDEKPIFEENGLKLFASEDSVKINKNLSGSLSNFIEKVKSGDYVALMAYIQRSPKHEEKLQAIRLRLRDGLKVATTLGYGPRFLHSTGQLHKGGANNGVFIQFTADDERELPIPGEPFGFSILKQAEALGDYLALKQHGRRTIRVHLGKDVQAGLQKFLSLLEEVVTVKR